MHTYTERCVMLHSQRHEAKKMVLDRPVLFVSHFSSPTSSVCESFYFYFIFHFPPETSVCLAALSGWLGVETKVRSCSNQFFCSIFISCLGCLLLHEYPVLFPVPSRPVPSPPPSMVCVVQQVYQPTGVKTIKGASIDVKERHAFVVFFHTDESGLVPVGKVRGCKCCACGNRWWMMVCCAWRWWDERKSTSYVDIVHTDRGTIFFSFLWIPVLEPTPVCPILYGPLCLSSSGGAIWGDQVVHQLIARLSTHLSISFLTIFLFTTVPLPPRDEPADSTRTNIPSLPRYTPYILGFESWPNARAPRRPLSNAFFLLSTVLHWCSSPSLNYGNHIFFKRTGNTKKRDVTGFESPIFRINYLQF